jgi:DNA-binding GntR family transcriptional regulator
MSATATALPILTDSEIYDSIVAAILDHRLAPGTKLGEEKLGRAFGVSRTRIRQVLVRLAAEQIVVITLNRGACVASPTPQEAREVFEARMLIEPPLIEAFLNTADTPRLHALQHTLRQEEQALHAGDRRAAVRLSGDFHLQIAEGAHNATLEKILRELVSRTSLILMTYDTPVKAHYESHSCGCHEHEALLEAILARNAREARRLMKRHLRHLLDQISFEAREEQQTDLEFLFARS